MGAIDGEQGRQHELPPHKALLEATKLGDLVTRYRDEVAIEKKCAEVEITILNAFLRHRICSKCLAKITVQDWSRYRDERLVSITGKSLKRELSPVRHMFGIAIKDWGYPLSDNPFFRLVIKSEDRRRERQLSVLEQAILTKEAENCRANYLAPVITLALETAMRRGELLKIRLEHIDFSRRLLSIPETKNGESRTIPLTETALELLRSRLNNIDRKGFLFSATGTALRLSWDRTCKRAKIADLHFHDLRHEAISRFFEMRLTTPEVALINSHKDVRMLFRYAHGTQKAILAKFDHRSE